MGKDQSPGKAFDSIAAGARAPRGTPRETGSEPLAAEAHISSVPGPMQKQQRSIALDHPVPACSAHKKFGGPSLLPLPD